MGEILKKLTPKQEVFCQEYLKDLNATQACIRAGFKAKNADVVGPQLIGKTWVKERIDELMSKRSKRIELSADKILNDIQEIHARCMQKEPVLDSDGQPTGEWKFESFAALRACELLGKHLKLFTDKIEHSFSENLAEKIAKVRKRNE